MVDIYNIKSKNIKNKKGKNDLSNSNIVNEIKLSLVICYKLKIKNISNCYNCNKIYKRTYMTRGSGGGNGTGDDPDKRKGFWDKIWGFHIKKDSKSKSDQNSNSNETNENTDTVFDNVDQVQEVTQEINNQVDSINTIVNNASENVSDAPLPNETGLIHYILTFGGLIDIRTFFYVGLGAVITGVGTYYIRRATTVASQVSNVSSNLTAPITIQEIPPVESQSQIPDVLSDPPIIVQPQPSENNNNNNNNQLLKYLHNLFTRFASIKAQLQLRLWGYKINWKIFFEILKKMIFKK